MSAPPETAAAPKERLSTAQMLHLMRLETQQAIRGDAPVSCVVFGLDGFEGAHELPGRRRLMQELFKLLKKTTFEGGLRGLGVFTDRYQLAVFPHLAPERVGELAERLIESARDLPDPRPDRDETITVSVGVSHTVHHGQKSFETLVREAESGMELARGAGGNRWVQAREIESEVDQLREELAAQIEEVQNYQSQYLAEEDGRADTWGHELIQKTLALFEREPDQNAAVVRLKKEVIALISSEITAWRESSTLRQMLESQRQIENLERRVRKLTENLGITEKELQRVAAMKGVDLGIASLYRTVQGLSSDDDQYEQKREMLKGIFEANLELQASE